MVRFLLIVLFVFMLPSPVMSAMNCGIRSTPDVSTFSNCVSDDYAPSTSLIDGPPSTSDALSRYQWGMRMVLEGSQYSHVLGDAPRDVKVAVIDIYPGDQGHPDLVNIYEEGINLVEGGTDTNPPVWDGNAGTTSNAHGQCAASIIGAEHNTAGAAGLFHRARIIPIRASFDTLDRAIDAAVTRGAEVIHIAGFDVSHPLQAYPVWPDYYIPNTHPLRWMFMTTAEAVLDAAKLVRIADAIQRATWSGTIITTVVGNWDGRQASIFHASNHETVVGSAVNILGEPSPFNANNYYTTMLAPGGDRREVTYAMSLPANVFTQGAFSNEDDVLCAIGPDKYSFGSGGSFAGPQMAAAAAIIKSYLPNATAQDVRRLLIQSKQPIKLNLHVLQSVGGMLSLKRLKAAILSEMYASRPT